jgi:protoporphyrinogen/coproporphyrinogen III oxidase
VRRVAVVGAGLAGLAAALDLARDGADVTVLEADGRVGGKIASVEVGGLRLEAGPDSLLGRKPSAVELIREVGLADDLVASSTSRTHVLSDRGLVAFPSGPFGIPTDPREIWRWPGLSRRGKLRAMRDLVARAHAPAGDESIGSLLRRRLGDEMTDALVGPLLGGLFAGDVDRLSLRATFPELAAWEREHGGLIHGAHVAAEAVAGLRAPMFVRLRGGLSTLPEALADRIGPARVRTSTPVSALERTGEVYVLSTPDGDVEADAVVLTAPAFAAADLVSNIAPAAAGELRSIPYVSTAVVLLVYAEGSNDRLPDSSGFVVPRGRLAMAACTLLSRKWPDPAFGSRAVVRCFVGATGSEELVDERDDDIVEGVSRQLAALLPLPGRADAAAVVRWRRAMPQYEVGHLERVERIERALPPGVVVAGQSYRGVGVADAIRQGRDAAARVSGLGVGKPVERSEGERVR